MEYQNLITGIMLMFCTWEDIRTRKISTKKIVLYSILVVLGKPVEIYTGAIPGILCFLVSVLTRQSLGYGDSMIILISGISLGIEQELLILFLAFFLSGAWASIGMITKKAERSSEFPFIPCLFIGWGLSLTVFH